MSQKQRIQSFWIIWLGLIASMVILAGMLSRFIGLNAIGRIIDWEPASESAFYATAVFDAAVLALPFGLIALFLLRRRANGLAFSRQLATVGAFVLAGALVSLSLVAVTLGWYAAVLLLAGLAAGSLRLHPTLFYTVFCFVGPVAIVIACILLAKIPTRFVRV